MNKPEKQQKIHSEPSILNTVSDKIKIHDIFQSIHKKMIHGFDYQDILNFLFMSLSEVVPYDRIGIALLEENDSKLRLNWVKAKIPINYLPQKYSETIKGSSLEEVLFSQKPRIINDLENFLKIHPHSKFTSLALQDGIKSNLTCPLYLNGKPIGIIFFSSAQIGTYKDYQVEFFEEIADGISLIVQQGILFQSLQELDAKEKLFRNTIHELNNPLGVIRGVLSVIGKKDWFNQLSEESRSVFQVLNRKNEAMVNLVRDLTMLNQVRGTKPTLSNNINLKAFIKELLLNSEMLAKPKEITVVSKIQDNLPTYCNFDSIRIMQVLENLVANAVKYSRANTTITVEVSSLEDGKKIFFNVLDQGQGIPKEELKNLYREYGTTSVRPTAGEPSSGLGLAIVKQVVEAHQGEVHVESVVGVGSEFGFWIPCNTSVRF